MQRHWICGLWKWVVHCAEGANVGVLVLYPLHGISKIQHHQMTTMEGRNIKVVGEIQTFSLHFFFLPSWSALTLTSKLSVRPKRFLFIFFFLPSWLALTLMSKLLVRPKHFLFIFFLLPSWSVLTLTSIIGGNCHKYNFCCDRSKRFILTTRVCRDKGMTKIFCVCHKKHNFVATKHLSRQAYFCHNKRCVRSWQTCVCRKKSMLVTTKLYL